MPKILISDAMDNIASEILLKNNLDVETKTNLTPDELKNIIANYDGLIVRSATKVTDDIIEAATNLKIIGRAGAGVDNINVEAAKSKNIIVMNTPGGNTNATAEHTIGLILSITRNYLKAISSLNKNKWDRRPYAGEKMLSKSIVGVIGGGRIGIMVSKILSSFGSKVIVAEKKNKNFKIKLRQICRDSDIISLHIPSFKNDNFFSKNRFKLRKKFYLINTSRGDVVDENYVLELLKKRLMLGYAADVLNNEFDASFKLSKNIIFKNRNKFNIILTPHIGGSTKDSWRLTEKSIILELKEQISKTT